MKKLFTLLTLALFSIGTAWAATGTEKATNQGTGNGTITGTCYTLDGIYVAGKGGVKKGNMDNAGVKLRTNQTNNYITFTVNANYTITDFKFYCVENGTNDDEQIVAVYVDDDTETNKIAATIDVPNKNGSTSADVHLTSISATKNIIIKFNDKNRQICGYYELTWSRLEPAGNPTINDDNAGNVTIEAGANATKVVYTTDGTDPTAESTTYSAPFAVEDGTTVKALSIGDGSSYGNSDIVSKLITITGTVIATPVVTSYNGTVKITCATAGVTLGYNTDGTETYATYTSPFTLLEDATVYVKATRTGSSDVTTSQAVTAVSKGAANNTIYISHGSLDESTIANGATVTMKPSDDAYGYSIKIDNDEKAYSSLGVSIAYGQGASTRSAIKLSNGATNILYLPTGVKATRLTLYSVINSATVADVSGWKEVNGVDYQAGDGDYKNFPMTAFNDVAEYATHPDVRVYNLGETEGPITFTNAGSQLGFVIALDVIEPPISVPTNADRNYATFVTPAGKKLDFKTAEGITAYIATGLNGAKDAVVLQEVNVVPAKTPIIVKTDTKGATVNVPVTTADASDVSANKLIAGDGSTAATEEYYYLANDLFHQANAGTLQSGKAYLHITTSAPVLNFVFGDVTGIGEIKTQKIESGQFFDLQGRKVAQPTKGLYIVNGKKVIIK